MSRFRVWSPRLAGTRVGDGIGVDRKVLQQARNHEVSDRRTGLDGGSVHAGDHRHGVVLQVLLEILFELLSNGILEFCEAFSAPALRKTTATKPRTAFAVAKIHGFFLALRADEQARGLSGDDDDD